MDRTPIYLESDDEITSAVDKLKSAEGSSLDIVIPKDSVMLQSVINLKLLKRQAESLGKEITIITQDKVGQKLATQIGIPVAAKEGQVPKEVNIAEAEKPEFSEDDIEVKDTQETPEVQDEEKVVEPTKETVDEVAQPKAAKKKSWLRLHKNGALIAAAFGVVALAVLAYIYVPLAKVTIHLAAESKTLDLSFVADKSVAQVDTEAQKIPAREVMVEVEKEETFQATGKKDVGEKASGVMVVQDVGNSTSCYSPNSSTSLVAGTRFVSSGGLVFRSTTNVTIPGCTVVGGHVTALGAAVNVNVQADKPGEQYNLSPQSFSIPALNSTFVTAKNTAAFSGGSTKTVTYIVAADITSAKEKLTESMKSEVGGKIDEALEDGETLLDGASKIEEVSAEPSSAVGAEVSEFKIKMKSKGTALVFKQDDLKSLAEGVLAQEIGSTKEIVEKEQLISEAKTQKLDLKAGTLEATLSGEAYIAAKMDQNELRNQLNGEADSGALEYLNGLEGVDSVEVRYFPSFYKRFPRINSHINFEFVINKTQE